MFDEFLNKMNSDEAPDGLTDASDYINALKNHVENTRLLGHPDDAQKVNFILNQMAWFTNETDEGNEIDIEKIMESYTALCFILTTFAQLACLQNENFVDIYVDSMLEQVIPRMEEEASAVPYWNE